MSLIRDYLLRFLVKNYPFKRGSSRVFSLAMKRVHGILIFLDGFGNRLLLDLDNYIDSRIFLQGSYEKDNIRSLIKASAEYGCSYFVDIGANFGLYTVTFASHPEVLKVWAFEPDPRNYAQLLANLFLNDLYNKVIPCEMALSSTVGEAVLYISEMPRGFDHDKFNSGTNSLVFRKDRHTRSIKVKISRMDDLVKVENANVAVKIDVEGHEYSVLKGMHNFLMKNNVVILLESFPDQFPIVDNYLSDLGFHKLDSPTSSDCHLYRKQKS